MDEVVPKPVNIEVIKEILDEIIYWIKMFSRNKIHKIIN